MSMLRYALPALAAVGSAKAACSASATYTIQSPEDAASLTTCSTFSGDIAIQTSATGDLSLSGVQRIEGSLSIVGAPNVTSLIAGDLEKIDDELNLDNVQTLSTLTLTQLTNAGSFVLNALPNLASISANLMETGLFSIQNTGLTSLAGINLTQCDNFTLANNDFLQDVSVQLEEVNGGIVLESNGDRLTVEFPNLQWAVDITFRNVPSVSIPELMTTNGSLGFIENEELTNVSCPKLTKVGHDLSINTNDNLKSISFPKLVTVNGALNVENNTALTSIVFPLLETVGGAFDAYGNFSKIELPKISNIKGAFNVQSSKDITSDCSTFENEHGPSNVIKGDYTCAGEQSHPAGAGSTPTGSAATTSKTGNAAVNVIPATALSGVMGVLAAMFGML